MTNLNEYCLHQIFDYLTPRDWIQVSKVCQLWKMAATRHWKKINEIIYLDENLEPEKNCNRSKAPTISAGNAKNLVIYAAPFVKVLRASNWYSKNKRKNVLFGPVWYKVERFNSDDILKLLAKHTTGITEVWFNNLPKPELLQHLFMTNKIEKIIITKPISYLFYQNVQTDKVEDLTFVFDTSKDILSFEGHFENLKKLNIGLKGSSIGNCRKVLSQILPFVVGIKLLKLDIPYSPIGMSNFLGDIFKLSQLEQLSLTARNAIGDAKFIKQLVTCCPELRVVKFVGFYISGKELQYLLQLPQLESLEANEVHDLFPMDIPKGIKLARFHIQLIYDEHIDIASLCSAVEKMSNVLSIEIDCIYVLEKYMELACEVTLVAALQGKAVLLMLMSAHTKSSKKLKIMRNDLHEAAKSSDVELKTLKLVIVLYNNDFGNDIDLDSAKPCLQKRLKHPGLFIIEDEYE